MKTTAKLQQPLRRITQLLIAAPGAYSRQKVKLECGHEAWCSGNAIYRARCRHCAAAAATRAAPMRADREDVADLNAHLPAR